MEDQRRDIRVKALLGAVVGLVEGNEKIPCQVRNISETGARLLLSNGHALPSEFILTIANRGLIYRARAVWRSMTEVGIEFIEALHSSQRTAPYQSSQLVRGNSRETVEADVVEENTAHLEEEAAYIVPIPDSPVEDDLESHSSVEQEQEQEQQQQQEQVLTQMVPEVVKADVSEALEFSQDGNVWAQIKRLELEQLKLKREMMELKAKYLAIVS